MDCGKNIEESKAEVQRSIEILRYFSSQNKDPSGDVFHHPRNEGLLLYSRREPLGVVSVITPWNPLAIPIWKIAPAIVHGNSVILKPASDAPLLGSLIAECWDAVGLPKGVFNLVSGSGSVAQVLTSDPSIDGITFTGSTTTGNAVAKIATENGKKFQLEMGGKNPSIVLSDADIGQAARATIGAGFTYSGQKCTATSRAIVHSSVFEKFVRELVKETEKLQVGTGHDPNNTVVPLINAESTQFVLHSIQKSLQDEGAKLVTGGVELARENCTCGAPTIITGVSPHSYLANEEIFGPVLAVIRAKDDDEAIKIANGTQYGLSASIFTRNLNAAFRFVDHIEAGMIRINGSSTGAELHVPFGGMKNSSAGPREQGKAAAQFFTKLKTVYVEKCQKLNSNLEGDQKNRT